MTKKIKSIPKMIYLHPRHVTMVEEMMDRDGMLSFSDGVRQAIITAHRQKLPPYLKPSVYEQEKEQELSEQERLDSMSPEDFATHMYPDCLFGKLKSGERCFIIHTWGNAVRAVPISNVRDFYADTIGKELSDFHKQTNQDNPMSEVLRRPDMQSYLQQTYGVDSIDLE